MSLTLCMKQNVKTFRDGSGVEYTVGGSWLLRCDNAALRCYSVKSGTRFIDGDAFEGCEKLRQVVLPNTVIHIGNWAFYRCQALECMVIPPSVITIGDRAFSDCKSMKSLFLMGKLKSLGSYAFLSCDALERIVIPRGTRRDYEAMLPQCYWPLFEDCDNFFLKI